MEVVIEAFVEIIAFTLFIRLPYFAFSLRIPSSGGAEDMDLKST